MASFTHLQNFHHAGTALSCKLSLGKLPLKSLKGFHHTPWDQGFVLAPESSRKEQAKQHFAPR